MNQDQFTNIMRKKKEKHPTFADRMKIENLEESNQILPKINSSH